MSAFRSGRLTHPNLYDSIALAERYGIKPDGLPGAKTPREIEEALHVYRDKKYIVIPPMAHRANFAGIIEPGRTDLSDETVHRLSQKTTDVLTHAYGDMEETFALGGDYMTVGWTHPTGRIPLGRIASFKVTTGGRHAVAKIPTRHGSVQFNTGHLPTMEECVKYNLLPHSYKLQTAGTCQPWSALRLLESDLPDPDFLAKVLKTYEEKELSNLDVIPTRIFQDIDLTRLEKSNSPQPDIFKKGGIVKKRKEVKSK